MGAAYFIVLEKDIPGIDPYVNGEALFRSAVKLDRLAGRLSVKPLRKFSPEEEDASEWGGSQQTKVVAAEWFDPEPGLVTVDALLRHLGEAPAAIHNGDEVVADLEDFRRILISAKKSHVRWRLEVDL